MFDSTWNSPVRKCPSFLVHVLLTIFHEFWICSLNTRQSKSGTRPRPSARTKWLGEPADMRSLSQAGDLCEASETRVTSSRWYPDERSNFWFSKNSKIYHLMKKQGILGDTRLRTFISSIRSSFRYCIFFMKILHCSARR